MLKQKGFFLIKCSTKSSFRSAHIYKYALCPAVFFFTHPMKFYSWLQSVKIKFRTIIIVYQFLTTKCIGCLLRALVDMSNVYRI